MKARVARVTIPRDKRVICISDIHGCLDMLMALLDKVRYTHDDCLLLLGDLYTKGRQCHETLRYIMALAERPRVYALRGNCDEEKEYLNAAERAWLDALPHAIETDGYIFVHGGIEPGPLEEQDEWALMKNDAFMERGLAFDKYVVTGHWPTFNYSHGIPCCNPIIDRNSRIIAIDGGAVLKTAGQLNAFIIHNGAFSFEYVDALPLYTVKCAQAASGGALNITWNDRFVELVEEGAPFGLYRHLATGRTISIPAASVWTDREGRLCECDNGLDYCLPVEAGDTVSVIEVYGDRMLVKKRGTIGWLYMDEQREDD